MSTYVLPDWNAPLLMSERIAATPQDVTLRGMFFTDVLNDVRAAGHPMDGSYVPFKSYPCRTYLQLLADAAPLLHPGVPMREALRRMGRTIYPRFADTMAGKAVFAFAGKNFERMAVLSAKAYRVGGSHGDVKVTESRPGYLKAELREIWILPDCLQVGNWEGGLQVAGASGQIRVRIHSLCDVDFEIEWK